MIQDIFQLCMITLQTNYLEVIPIHDDICFFEKISDQHDDHLLQVMHTVTKMP